MHTKIPKNNKSNLIKLAFQRDIVQLNNNMTNSIPRKLPIGNSTGYFTRYIEIVREICNSTARVK